MQSEEVYISFIPMRIVSERVDTAWRKSRLAARLLLRQESRPLRPREKLLALRLSQDAEVTNRLIQQALYFLGIGSRKHAFDKKLVDGKN
ncbi:MAG: hypothetical protein JWM99_5176 [Verrucomicrobiales bacterium]|nr:hypothetical protein [Verrucomicrobiales bacterium]